MKTRVHIANWMLGITMLLFPLTVFASSVHEAPVDTARYHDFSYIKFLCDGDSVNLTDEEFFQIAGKVVFPVNKWYIPKKDSLIVELDERIIPMINSDSLKLVRVLLRGAASPEGPFTFNKFLGEHRAQSLLDYMNKRLVIPIDENVFDETIDIEDYRTLCMMMRQRGDADYSYVQELCDRYMPSKDYARMKAALQKAHGGRLWQRIYREYFTQLRTARLVLFFQCDRARLKADSVAKVEVAKVGVRDVVETARCRELPDMLDLSLRLPRRELLSVKSNLLFDFAYVPGYNRWCPIPNVAIEYYPKKGHFTFGASIDFPWWQHYWDHKFFQIRNYQLETRYYLRSGDIESNPPGQGAAFRGLYLQGYVHSGIFGICFDENRGWEGEGVGAGVGVGYVMPLSRDGHWRLEFALQAGYFAAKYDPYQYENPVNSNYVDHLYYYKWTLKPDLFKRRQYRYSWLGPTRIGVTLSYDLLYRRNLKRGMSFNKWETIVF